MTGKFEHWHEPTESYSKQTFEPPAYYDERNYDAYILLNEQTGEGGLPAIHKYHIIQPEEQIYHPKKPLLIDYIGSVPKPEISFIRNREIHEDIVDYIESYQNPSENVFGNEIVRTTSHLSSFLGRIRSKLSGNASKLITPKMAEECPLTLPEIMLVAQFSDLLSNISIDEVAVKAGDKPIAHADQFSLVPVISNTFERRSSDKAGYKVSVNEDVVTTYGSSNEGKPYLDSGQAIGLVYGDKLIAISAACVDESGALKIVQLQDVTGVRKDTAGRAYFKTGLHNGLMWRDTLVAAWEKIGQALDSTGMVLQSNMNNSWSAVRDAGDRGYDDVAKRMGYVLDDATGNWVKPDWKDPEEPQSSTTLQAASIVAKPT